MLFYISNSMFLNDLFFYVPQNMSSGCADWGVEWFR
ncbi:hypothetical protein PSEUDO8Z_160222 [Pseudomonas sp. 8Z]|nr:hypothetical protein PSEUDO8Z_160222 [Pseudomonas sp. 8Z]